MSFARMQETLRAEGWFVEWNMPCCQSCAWGDVPDVHQVGPFKGQDVDLSKVLFNHSQDCEVADRSEEECEYCDGTGFTEDGDRIVVTAKVRVSSQVVSRISTTNLIPVWVVLFVCLPRLRVIQHSVSMAPTRVLQT